MFRRIPNGIHAAARVVRMGSVVAGAVALCALAAAPAAVAGSSPFFFGQVVNEAPPGCPDYQPGPPWIVGDTSFFDGVPFTGAAPLTVQGRGFLGYGVSGRATPTGLGDFNPIPIPEYSTWIRWGDSQYTPVPWLLCGSPAQAPAEGFDELWVVDLGYAVSDQNAGPISYFPTHTYTQPGSYAIVELQCPTLDTPPTDPSCLVIKQLTYGLVVVTGTGSQVDSTPPAITLTRPADGASYLLGSDVRADYSCADESGGAGLDSCTGTVPFGERIDTATIGPKTFAVNAADRAGNRDAKSASYNVIWNFGGFFAPVDNEPTLNTVGKAGTVIPIKFDLAGNQRLDVLAAGSPSSQRIGCDSGAPTDGIEQTLTAGASGLSYDPVTDEYMYAWKTDRVWARTCRRLVLKLADGTVHYADFRFVR